jgi:hypothetical protein
MNLQSNKLIRRSTRDRGYLTVERVRNAPSIPSHQKVYGYEQTPSI